MSHPLAKAEIRLEGIGVSPGISFGQADFVGNNFQIPERKTISPDAVEDEKKRLEAALDATREQIQGLKAEIEATAPEGSDHATIFDFHLFLIDDGKIIGDVINQLEKELCSVDWAYYQVITSYTESLKNLPDKYFSERFVDVKDVGQRVLRNLRWPDGGWTTPQIDENASIVLAHDLTPSDTVNFNRDKVKGFATEAGSATSHTAIMAHSLNIPAVVALHNFRKACQPGDTVLVDGFNGLLIINPTEATLEHYAPFMEQVDSMEKDLSALKEVETATRDGKRIILSANIEFVDELEVVSQQGAEGVGLYRTEFFYLTDKSLRSQANQAENYSRVAKACGDHGVIIRTLDIGGDKLHPELYEDPEPNPFLGWRGVRVSLDCPEEFKIQLRAILQASAAGKVRVMYPFISNLGEVIEANRLLEEAKDELRQQGIPFDENIEKGAMIEIPSAVMVADHIAKEVDFFSIGTNDLVQYTTAVDRVNDRVANLYRPAHPAVIEMVRLTVQAAHRNHIWCGICGEAASDLHLTPIWVGLGIDELSVGPAQVLRLRKAISLLSTEECNELADIVKTKGRAKEIFKISNELAGKTYPELLLSPA